jgi:adenosine deaminase
LNGFFQIHGMTTTLTLDLIRQLPKAEIHCHLDGAARPETIIELAHEQNVSLPTTNLDELRLLMICPTDCPNLETYLTRFDIVLSVMQYPYAITRIFYEACEDAAKDGIVYLELRFAPAYHTKNNHSYSQILDAAVQGCLMAEQRLPITARIICCAMRQMDPEINAVIAEICWRYSHRFVVGFDLAGPEYGFPPDKHVKAFRKIRRKLLSVTVQASEGSVALALKCLPQRIGHGTQILKEPQVLNTIIDRRIPLEICVSSNIQTKSIRTVKDHPVRQLFDLGALTCPCTNNPTVSGVTLSSEYLLLQNEFGFTVPEILKLIDYSFQAAFVNQSMRKRFRIEAFLRATKILAENGIDLTGIDSRELGVTFPPKFVPTVLNQPLTVAVLQQLPKCDVDCRLIGSVPLPLLYRFYTELSEAARSALPRFDSFESFTELFLQSDSRTLTIALLQTEANLRLAIHAILQEAFSDNVAYLELTMCPLLHTKAGLSPNQVLDIVLDVIANFQDLRTSVVINANIQKLNPLEIQALAELTVAYHDRGVVGFATTSAEIGVSQMRFFESTFTYLADHFIPVTIFAGETDPESISSALVNGHARRISGGFQITENESLLNDVTSHNIVVLISDSKHMETGISGWKRSPVRFFTDFGVKLAFSSIHHSLTNVSRSDQLFRLAQKAGFDAASLLRMIDDTFNATFLPYKEIVALREMFWKKADTLLAELGFGERQDCPYFPSE